MKKTMAIVFVMCFHLLCSAQLQAMDKAYIPVTARIPQLIILELSGNALVFDEVDFDYLLGTARLVRAGVAATKKRAVTATISANIPYTLYISAPEEYLVGEKGGLINITQLTWKLSEQEAWDIWEPITLERAPIKVGLPGITEVELDFRLTTFWENTAELYRGEILLTVIPEGT